MEIVLAMDTSFQGLSLALYDQKKGVLASYQSDALRDQARLLHPELQKMLQGLNLKMQDISAICVTSGPGSFTGVRLSLAAAKAFALAVNCPIYTTTTLEAVAYTAAQKIKADFWVCLEAGRDKLFAQKFNAEAKALTEVQTYLHTDFIHMLSATDKVVGQAALKLYGLLPDGVENVALKEESLRLPLAADFVQFFSENWSTTVEPLYLQPLTYRKTYDKSGKPLESFKG